MKECNSCPPGSTPYTVRSGDTLWNIARSYGMSVNDIIRANPGIDPVGLQVGQLLCLPFTGENYPMCRSGNYYVVGEKTNFKAIAAYFGVTEDMLYKNNLGIDPNALYRGQVLCIPVAPSPVRLEVGGGRLRVVHKNGGETSCRVRGELGGDSCVINKQLEIEKVGARILNLSDGGAISGEASGYGGVVVGDEDMDALFNLVPVGTAVVKK